MPDTESLRYDDEVVVTELSLLETPPRYRSGDDPAEFPEAKAYAEQGRGQRVKAQAIVTREGAIAEPELLLGSGDTELDAKILEALAGWKLWAGRKDGEAVPSLAKFSWFIGKFPDRLEGGQPAMPEEAKALGHHGAVRIAGTIMPDGSIGNAEVSASSRSTILDAAALEAVKGWRYAAPFDLQGEPASYDVVFALDFGQGKDGGSYLSGIETYRCEAFIKEYDWWRSAFPEADPDDYDLRKMLIGAEFLVAISKSGDTKGFKDRMERWNGKFAKTIEGCRKRPRKLFREEYRKAK
ncbi:energy transducer TonB [Parerythrobacter aestuarii]|uniref:energy transducer TonB n=1 Tax=Parerythrobacter aestuarii TaxID=3020909 RepID=UPI0024DEDE07|nr:energy transducer TonB [Parerythrobacter aestuarii]